MNILEQDVLKKNLNTLSLEKLQKKKKVVQSHCMGKKPSAL